MFPLYFKNMRSTLRKLYPGEGEDQLRLRAWTMATRAAGKGPLANTGNQGLEKKVEEARTERNIDVVKDDKPKEVEEAPKPSEETSEAAPLAAVSAVSDPFAMFSGAFRPIVTSKNPGLSLDQVEEVLANMWRNMGPESRASFVQRAEASLQAAAPSLHQEEEGEGELIMDFQEPDPLDLDNEQPDDENAKTEDSDKEATLVETTVVVETSVVTEVEELENATNSILEGNTTEHFVIDSIVKEETIVEEVEAVNLKPKKTEVVSIVEESKNIFKDTVPEHKQIKKRLQQN